MDKITWREQFNSGISGLDAENRNLLELINRLIEVRNNEARGSEALAASLFQLQDHVRKHFTHEERYLKQTCRKDFEWHQQQHAFFKENLALFCFEMLQQDKIFLDDFCYYLTEWFVFHVTNFDKRVVPVCREDASKKR